MFKGSKAFLALCFWYCFVYIVNMISVVYYLFTLCISVTIVYWVHWLNRPECIVSFGSSCLKKYCTCSNISCMYHSKRKKKTGCYYLSLKISQKSVLSFGSSLSLCVCWAEQEPVHWFGLKCFSRETVYCLTWSW